MLASSMHRAIESPSRHRASSLHRARASSQHRAFSIEHRGRGSGSLFKAFKLNLNGSCATCGASAYFLVSCGNHCYTKKNILPLIKPLQFPSSRPPSAEIPRKYTIQIHRSHKHFCENRKAVLSPDIRARAPESCRTRCDVSRCVWLCMDGSCPWAWRAREL